MLHLLEMDCHGSEPQQYHRLATFQVRVSKVIRNSMHQDNILSVACRHATTVHSRGIHTIRNHSSIITLKVQLSSFYLATIKVLKDFVELELEAAWAVICGGFLTRTISPTFSTDNFSSILSSITSLWSCRFFLCNNKLILWWFNDHSEERSTGGKICLSVAPMPYIQQNIRIEIIWNWNL